MPQLKQPMREDVDYIGRELRRLRARIAQLERRAELDDLDTLIGVAEAEARRFARRLPAARRRNE
ncbi:hypothetical protein [Pseudaminobacter sp. NGMCC 1.201702]|uniref:hypothetical protein n=1 Tax=Pseudaminobacter sp. NGMCC 1.201702 TaxID=3391825 RepID=UPI0039EF1108